jgi:hypothetical protein
LYLTSLPFKGRVFHPTSLPFKGRVFHPTSLPFKGRVRVGMGLPLNFHPPLYRQAVMRVSLLQKNSRRYRNLRGKDAEK